MQRVPNIEDIYTGSLPAFSAAAPDSIMPKRGQILPFGRRLTGFNGIATLRPTCPKGIDRVNVLSFSGK
jgi:hypothetical protein